MFITNKLKIPKLFSKNKRPFDLQHNRFIEYLGGYSFFNEFSRIRPKLAFKLDFSKCDSLSELAFGESEH